MLSDNSCRVRGFRSIVAIGLLSTAVTAQAAYPGSPYAGYPDWAQSAFQNYGG